MKNLIVSTVYNEEKYIGKTIDDIRSISNVPILIINDGSTDNSSAIIKSKSPDFLINHSKNFGYGKSLIDGFNFAIENRYTNIITIDGDLQHVPYMIPIFINKIKKYDIISGSRYLYIQKHKEIVPPASHYLYHNLITNIINDIFKSSITDSFCGYKAYKVKKLRCLDLDIEGYGIAIQIIVQMLYKNLKYFEIPVPMIYHNPIKELIPPDQKIKYFLDVLSSELKKLNLYDDKIFTSNIEKEYKNE
jgi:dolichol-phosphate mannosyltransferase